MLLPLQLNNLLETSGDVEVSVGVASLTLTTYQATISYDVDVSVGTAGLTLATYSADVALDVDVAVSTAALSITTNAATISYDINVDAGTAALTVTTYQATVDTTTDIDVSVGTVNLGLTTYQATIDATDAVIEEDAYSGGYAFINAYEAYRQRKRKRDKERKEVLEAIRDIEDDADREIAQWLQKDIVRDERDIQIAELERFVESTHQKAQDRDVIREMSWRVANAYERAYKQKNFSAIEAFEREMERYIEEEEFLLMAMLL